MTIKKYKHNNCHYLFIVNGIKYWMTIQQLMNQHPVPGLTKKQLYDRISRLSKGHSGFKTVYYCVKTSSKQAFLQRSKRAGMQIKITGSLNLWPVGSLAQEVIL